MKAPILQPVPCTVHDRLVEKLELLLNAHAQHLNAFDSTQSSSENTGEARRACTVAEQALDVHDAEHGCQLPVAEHCGERRHLLETLTLATQRAVAARGELLRTAEARNDPTPFVFALGEAVMDEDAARVALAAHRKTHGC